MGAVTDSSPVSIGIPTFNRAHTLERAVRSVLAQTHSNLELVISDNASSDHTEELCRTIAAQDARVRYTRQLRNLGSTANFNALFAGYSSPYVMVLADDDWLEQPGCAAVSGRGRYWRGDTRLARRGLGMQLSQRDGAERALAYLRLVGEGKGETSTFFGVMPAEVLRRATPMPNLLGNDIVVTARVAFQGPVRTLDGVHINRSVGGTSVSMRSIVNALGLSPGQARWPDLVIAAHLLGDIGWRDAVYADLPPLSRLGWALRCASAALNWKSFAWHATAPIAISLGRRPRGAGHGWPMTASPARSAPGAPNSRRRATRLSPDAGAYAPSAPTSSPVPRAAQADGAVRPTPRSSRPRRSRCWTRRSG